MLNELVAFGKSIRKPEDHDALKQEIINFDICIDAQGKFHGIIACTKVKSYAEALQVKAGKARLLLDKKEEVFGLTTLLQSLSSEEIAEDTQKQKEIESIQKKHSLFLNKLQEYAHIPTLQPVILFYGENKILGLDVALLAMEALPEKEQKGNFAFRLHDATLRMHEYEDVKQAIIRKYEEELKDNTAKTLLTCSICGKADFPIVDKPHGKIKGVPDGHTTGCVLVSYDKAAFESYDLKGNENSSICTACARNYVEGLNFLLTVGREEFSEKGKPDTQYTHKKKLSFNTAMIFWTKNKGDFPELNYVDAPQTHHEDIMSLLLQEAQDVSEVRADAIASLLNSPFTAKKVVAQNLDGDRFYSCILSGASARIAIRSWLESSTHTVRENILTWFHDIAIYKYDNDAEILQEYFPPLPFLAKGAARPKGARDKQEDPYIGRAATILWQCALNNTTPPYSLLHAVLRRICAEQGHVTAERVSLLKLILNRVHKLYHKGGQRMQAQLDYESTDIAYMAGRIFAMLESIQIAALGKDLNAPIKDRFFSAASTTPAAAFGRLMKLSNNHLNKLRIDKRGLYIHLENKLGELCAYIPPTGFPAIFSLEEQGRFAIGYYHQKQESFATKNSENNAIYLQEEGV